MAESHPFLFDLPPNDPGPKRPANPCTPAKIGSGPEGETCRTCVHKVRVKMHDYKYLKCNLMRERWTMGAGSDIKAGWPACREWEPKEATQPSTKESP